MTKPGLEFSSFGLESAVISIRLLHMFPMQLKVTHVDGGIVVKYLKPSTYFRSETEELDSEQTRAFQPNLGPPDKKL